MGTRRNASDFSDNFNVGHLTAFSSTAGAAPASGTTISEQRYLPFGEVREIDGLTDITQTDYGFTGQRNYAYINLLDYGARWYSPSLGRFTQPDTIIPNLTNTQSWNRYSYAYNNPLYYTDPSGHVPTGENDDDVCLPSQDCWEDDGYGGAGGGKIGLASSTQENTPRSQYSPYNPFYDGIVSEGHWGNNLCSLILLSIILENENPNMFMTLFQIWKIGMGMSKDKYGALKLLKAITKSFPSNQSWNGVGYNYDHFQEMRNNTIVTEDGVLDKHWYLDDKKNNIVQSTLMRSLTENHYTIALVTIDGDGELIAEGAPNLITDMTESSVNIINPFQNRYETHSWEDFNKTMQNESGGAYVFFEVWRDD